MSTSKHNLPHTTQATTSPCPSIAVNPTIQHCIPNCMLVGKTGGPCQTQQQPTLFCPLVLFLSPRCSWPASVGWVSLVQALHTLQAHPKAVPWGGLVLPLTWVQPACLFQLCIHHVPQLSTPKPSPLPWRPLPLPQHVPLPGLSQVPGPTCPLVLSHLGRACPGPQHRGHHHWHGSSQQHPSAAPAAVTDTHTCHSCPQCCCAAEAPCCGAAKQLVCHAACTMRGSCSPNETQQTVTTGVQCQKQAGYL